LLGLLTVGCRSCGLIQTNPRPSAAGLQTFYALHYRQLYQGVHGPSDGYIAEFHKAERLRYTATYLMKALALTDSSVLLDYGCGEGSLFVALRQAGFGGRLLGVEPNANFARFAAEQGRAEVFPSLDAFEGIDAVVINHALEHLADPVGLLRDIARCLAPAGCLYVDVPDAERYTHVGDLHLAHILHFTGRTLPALVNAAGFKLLSCEPHEPPHHPFSLRLRAQPDERAASESRPCNAETEAGTWQQLRALNARRWRWMISQRLARVGPLRALVSVLKRWSSPPAGG
jgi:SAM-dependent methyltransferase